MESVEFFTDSKKPKISKTEPGKGFASGTFDVEFKEENPRSLILHYGNDIIGLQEHTLNIANECFEDRSKMKCSTSVDISNYDGMELGYMFELSDIVGQIAVSKEKVLDVDVTSPVINDIFWTIDRGRAEVTIDLTEMNFDEVVYTNNDDNRPRERRFCSRLDSGICTKKIKLNDGMNSIDIGAVDEAGNAVGQNIQIEYITA